MTTFLRLKKQIVGIAARHSQETPGHTLFMRRDDGEE